MTTYALSLDDVSSLKEFAKAQKLEFKLLSDPDGSAAGKFGAMMDKRPFAKRVTFVIDPEGVLRHVDESVDVTKHGSDLVSVIKKLQQG